MDGIELYPWWLAPVDVRVLLATDSDGSFTATHRFGLTELVGALTSQWHAGARYAVTTAHRGSSGAFAQDAAIKGVTFTEGLLSRFDVVWLVGIGTPSEAGTTTLTGSEIEALARFMNQGGGLFACGDHQNLGNPLCAALPRVRSMRRWGGPGTPAVVGATRHDTLVPGHDARFDFDDQSDDIPQQLRVRRYAMGAAGKLEWSFPHPLLCSSRGAITVLPDHHHEGDCIDPPDLTATFTAGAFSAPEYPSGVAPEVVAWGRVTRHRTRLEQKDVSTGTFNDTRLYLDDDFTAADKEFGVIGAYNGHQAGIGRVVVDSTFHHFVNVNVNGAGSNSADPVKQKGFTFTPGDGPDHYAAIQAYWRNIARWLAPPNVQQQIAARELWAARWTSAVREVAGDDQLGASWPGKVRLGGYAWSGATKLIAPCAVLEYVGAFIDPRSVLLPTWVYLDLIAPDPPPWERPRLLVDAEELVLGVLGGVVDALARELPADLVEQVEGDETGPRVLEVARTAARKALDAGLDELAERLDQTRRFLDAVRG